MPIILLNSTGPYANANIDDLLFIGNRIFYSFQGVMWDFENKKVAFMEYPGVAKEDRHIKPSSSGLPGWAIALIVIGSILLVAGVGFIIFREKKLKQELQKHAEYS